MKRFIALLLLTSCGTVYDEPIQHIQVNLANQDNAHARCILETEDFRAQLEAPGTVGIPRSRKPLVVFCSDKDGDEFSQIVYADVNNTSWWNVTNGGVGFAYDVLSDTAWQYPNPIEIDFYADTASVYNVPAPKTYPDYVMKNAENLRANVSADVFMDYENAQSLKVIKKVEDKKEKSQAFPDINYSEYDPSPSHISKPIVE